MNIEIRMLGRFEVLADGVAGRSDPWRRKHAAALVKILGLARHRSMHREQFMDLLWPELTVAEAAPRLHKAAHYARQGLPSIAGTVVLRGELISLMPGLPVTIDVLEFESAAEAALAETTEAAAVQALARYTGTFLPEDRYEPWAEVTRGRLSMLHLQLLRQAGRWDELIDTDPTDEEAHLSLMRAYLRTGDRTSVLRQFERMDRALRRELGIGPGIEAVKLRDLALATVPESAKSRPADAADGGLIGRDEQLAAIRAAMVDVASGSGRTLLVRGPAGVGKTALLGVVRSQAKNRGWRTGMGASATVEGAWPYAPVLEALADLCRAHPTLLDAVDDRYREELDRALSLRIAASVDGGHQRLFIAASALLSVAAAGCGVALVIDDVHEADDASLRLLHYLARSGRNDPILLVVAYRDDPDSEQLAEFWTSLSRRDSTIQVPVNSLGVDATMALVRRVSEDLPPETIDQIWQLSAGLPFAVTELARAAASAPDRPLPPEAGSGLIDRLSKATRDLLVRVAITGQTFDTDEFVALSGLPDRLAYARLESALSARIIDRISTGYRFRHALLREQLLAGLSTQRRIELHHEAAQKLTSLGASPARIGHHLVAAGRIREAIPHVLAAARTEAAVGAYRDALTLLDTTHGHVTGSVRAEVAVLRGELLVALGDPRAVEVYREAVRLGAGELRRRARAGLARAATRSADLATGADALAGLELNGGPNDAAILLARGNVAYFQGDLDTAWRVAEQARELIVTGDEVWQLLDLVALQGLVAHTRGEWFERLSLELQHGQHAPQVAAAVFDSHLCVAEYLLYGPTPYQRVIELARSLRDTAQRSGVLPAVAFATALLGEAALLSGDLETAGAELTEAVELYRDIGARGGQAHGLQRLAEVYLARGERNEATALCERALPLARWSPMVSHLLQRIWGTLIVAAPDADSAWDVVYRAEATLNDRDFCSFCQVMFAVPASIACADVGDADGAQRHLAVAERSAGLWDGTAWQAAICEAQAHLAWVGRDWAATLALLDRAQSIFAAAGQPLDAHRCRAFQQQVGQAVAAWPHQAAPSSAAAA